MKLYVNGEAIDSDAATLSALLVEMAFEGDWLATAINGAVISADQRDSTNLQENDRIEILSPMQGG